MSFSSACGNFHGLQIRALSDVDFRSISFWKASNFLLMADDFGFDKMECSVHLYYCVRGANNFLGDRNP